MRCERARHNMKFIMQIPDNATNGDVIKTMFPNHEETVHNEPLGFTNGIDFVINMTRHECLKLWFPSGWWNAPYKIGDADDKRRSIDKS